MSQSHDFHPVPVHRAGPLRFTCCRCHQPADQAHGTVWADRCGEPFKAYFHEHCMLWERQAAAA